MEDYDKNNDTQEEEHDEQEQFVQTFPELGEARAEKDTECRFFAKKYKHKKDKADLDKYDIEEFTRFLYEYSHVKNKTYAAFKARVSLPKMNFFLENIKWCKEQFELVGELYLARLEEKATIKAMYGSENMLQFLLKSHNRSTYGDKQEVDVSMDNNINITWSNSVLSPEELEHAKKNNMIGVPEKKEIPVDVEGEKNKEEDIREKRK